MQRFIIMIDKYDVKWLPAFQSNIASINSSRMAPRYYSTETELRQALMRHAKFTESSCDKFLSRAVSHWSDEFFADLKDEDAAYLGWV